MKNKTLNIVCISRSQHPDMEASAIRQSTLSKGLVDLGTKVDFYVLLSTYWNGTRTNINGINYISFNKKGKLSLISKIFDYLRSVIKTRNSILKSIKQGGIDAIILYPGEIFLSLIILKLVKRYNIRIYHERTELPYTVLGDSLWSKFSYKIYLKKILPRFNGIFVINDKLKAFIEQYNRNTKKILTVVDPDFFKTDIRSKFPFPYIAYCGKMSGSKDGVPILIEAFGQISKKFQEMKLVLIGDNSDKVAIQDTLKTIDKHDLKDKIVFTGLVNRNDMPILLGNAKILAVAKPSNEQNSGNFPIKLGEYLATGVPIVVTDVGEISKFVIDGHTGYLAKPDSVESFTQAMERVLTDYEKAKTVGMQGKLIAEDIFNYKVQAKEMLEYINYDQDE